MSASRLPHGSLRLAEEAIAAAPEGADPDNLARRALLAAMPAIQRAVLLDAARTILLLPGVASGVLCPECHGARVSWPGAPNPAFRSDRCRCKKGHEWDKPHGSKITTESLLGMLARGEPLPALPSRDTTL